MTLPLEPDAVTAVADPTPTEAFRASIRLPRGFSFFLVLAAIGAGAAQMSAALLTLTLKATELDAAEATTFISLSSALAGILTLVALPATGAFSDRSRSRFGRRKPFLLAAAALFVLGGTLLVVSTNLVVFVLAHLTITLGFVAAGVTVTALIADQLPRDRRGGVTAFVSMGTPLGALFGMAVAVPFGDNLVPLVGIPSLLAVAALVALAAVIHDPSVPEHRGALRLSQLVGVYWVNPLRFGSFAWVFASRMLVFSGVAALNGYQAIFMLQHLHLEPAGLGTAILLTVIINAGVTMLVTPAIGKLSDRLGIRKPFILVAALILAVGLVLAAVAPNFGFYLIACGVVGLGQGVYFAVELVLATHVLPDPDNPAKDLGILKIADNLPVSIVSAVAPALLALGAVNGPNFSALFIAGAIAAALGGVAILLVRAAR